MKITSSNRHEHLEIGVQAGRQELTFANIIPIWGQSNNCDIGSLGALPSRLSNPCPFIRSFYKTADDALTNGSWVTYQAGITSQQPSAGGFAMNLTMSDKLFHTYGKAAFIVNSAIVSTPLAVDGANPTWDPATVGSLWTRATSYHLDQSILRLPTPNYKIPCLIWGQGEQDAGNLTKANAYNANLRALITAFRSRYGATIPVIIVKLRSDVNASSCPYASTVIAAQNDVIDTVANVYGFSMASYTMRVDLLHFTDASYMAAGEAMADLIYTFCQ